MIFHLWVTCIGGKSLHRIHSLLAVSLNRNSCINVNTIDYLKNVYNFIAVFLKDFVDCLGKLIITNSCVHVEEVGGRECDIKL